MRSPSHSAAVVLALLISGITACSTAEPVAPPDTPLPVRPLHSSERPGGSLDDPIFRPRDLSGRSVKTPRVRAVHSTDDSLAGTTAHLIRTDPWLAYARGGCITRQNMRLHDVGHLVDPSDRIVVKI